MPAAYGFCQPRATQRGMSLGQVALQPETSSQSMVRAVCRLCCSARVHGHPLRLLTLCLSPWPRHCLSSPLRRRGMSTCHPVSTPVDCKGKLPADGAAIDDAKSYRSLAGALQYLTVTHPDLAFAVQQACLHMHDPRAPHLALLKRILRYVRGTTPLGLHLRASTELSVTAYSACSLVILSSRGRPSGNPPYPDQVPRLSTGLWRTPRPGAYGYDNSSANSIAASPKQRWRTATMYPRFTCLQTRFITSARST